MAYAGFFSVVADLGLYLILIRDLNRPNADAERVVGNLLALRWLSALSILGAGTLFVLFFNFTATEKIAIAIASASFIAVAGTQLLSGVFQSKLAMRYVTTAELVGRAILLGLSWLVVRLDLGLYAVVLAVVAGSIINFLIVWQSTKKFLRIKLRFDRDYWVATLRDTVPIALSIVLNLIYFRADTIILRLYKGAYDVGLYGSAYKILEILNTFPIMFVGLLLPALGAAFAGQQRERFQMIFQKGFDLLLMAIVPMLIGGWWLAEPALKLFGGAEYAPAAPVLRLLLFAVAALFLGSLSGHTITIINRQRQMVWTYLGVAVLGLSLYLVLIPTYSLYGAAWGTIITETLIAIVGYILITRSIRFLLSPRVIPSVVLAGALMWGAIALLAGVNYWFAACVGSLVYLGMLFVTKTLSFDLVRQLVGRDTSAVSPIETSV
jgi:O-antigen/teichoic acid export membrane protein